MANPTDVRVEARALQNAFLRWTYPGANDIGIYRALTSGGSYTLIATVDNLITEYEDDGLDHATQYFYKLSEDGGSTFSSIVDVTTYVSSANKQIASNQLYNIPLQLDATDPKAFNELLIQLQQDHNKVQTQLNSAERCDLCLVNGAIVVDCTLCDRFRVAVTEDINSISLVGCVKCPDIEFTVAPGESHSVCGFPLDCAFTGDECFDEPITATENSPGRSCYTDGHCGEPQGPVQQGEDCPCSVVETRPEIICCDEDCDLECGGESSANLKVCGGIGPYTWEVDGPATLSSNTGTKVRVTPTEECSASFIVTNCAVLESACTGKEDCATMKIFCPNWYENNLQVFVSWVQGEEEGGCSASGSFPNFTLNCEPLCTGTITIDASGSCGDEECNVSGRIWGLTLTCGEATASLTSEELIIGTHDYELNPSGEVGVITVTVTDWTGLQDSIVL